jgi:hypothetical protein
LSTVVTTPVAPVSRTPQGIAAIMLGMTLFVFQDAMMKSLLGDFPVWPLLLVRAVVCSLVMVPLILYLGSPHRILTPLWPLHLARAILFAFGFSLYYAAFPFMTLAADRHPSDQRAGARFRWCHHRDETGRRLVSVGLGAAADLRLQLRDITDAGATDRPP